MVASFLFELSWCLIFFLSQDAINILFLRYDIATVNHWYCFESYMPFTTPHQRTEHICKSLLCNCQLYDSSLLSRTWYVIVSMCVNNMCTLTHPSVTLLTDNLCKMINPSAGSSLVQAQGRVIPKTLKMEHAAFSLDAQCMGFGAWSTIQWSTTRKKGHGRRY